MTAYKTTAINVHCKFTGMLMTLLKYFVSLIMVYLQNHRINCFIIEILLYRILNQDLTAGPDSAVGSKSQLASGSSQVRFPHPASFTSCQLPLKG